MAKLVKIGVPWEQAWKMNPAMRLAWLVIDGENEGGSFDWKAMRWNK